MYKRIGLWLAAVLLAIAPTLAIAGGPNGGAMPEPPSHVGEYLWLMELAATPESPDVFDIRVFKIYYNQVTNRIVILGDDDGTREIPTLTNDVARVPQTGSVMILDGNGELATTPIGATNGGFIDAGTDPAWLKWVQESATRREGAVLGLTDTSTPASVGLLRVPFLIAEVSSVNMNSGTKQDFFTVPSGRTLLIDYWLVRGASASLTTVEFSGGFNANADDVIARDTYTELTGSTLCSPRYVKKGAKLGAAGDVFGLKCATVQGSAATVTIEVYGHYVS